MSQLSITRNSLRLLHNQHILRSFEQNHFIHQLSSICSQLCSSNGLVKGAVALASMSAAIGYYYWYQKQDDSALNLYQHPTINPQIGNHHDHHDIPSFDNTVRDISGGSLDSM